jgi:hypothetical protein
VPFSGEAGKHLPGSSPEHKKRDQLGDDAGLSQIATSDGDTELCAVATHEGDEEMAETEITDCVNHPGKSRQESRKHQSARLAAQIASVLNRAASDRKWFGHGSSRNKL